MHLDWLPNALFLGAIPSAHGWDTNWLAIGRCLKSTVLGQRIGIALLLTLTLGVQMFFFPVLHSVLRFHPSSAMRMAYFLACLTSLGLFVWIYWAALFVHIYQGYWIILIAFVVACLLVYWLVTLPKKRLA